MTDLLKPALYRAEGASASPDAPALLGAACACGHVFFPLQTYGCERCGGLDIAPRALAPSGRLIASAEVHLHAGKGRTAPFTVATVSLDAGPVIRTLVKDGVGPLAVGQRMSASLEPVLDAEGEPRLDLRLVPEA